MGASFGDNVLIRATPETEAAGLAGLRGSVFGFTTPSVTGVDVIGDDGGDIAVNVHFDERGMSHWFAPGLVELLDHAPGTEIRIAGDDRRWIRNADGGWREEPPSRESRAWWRLW